MSEKNEEVKETDSKDEGEELVTPENVEEKLGEEKSEEEKVTPAASSAAEEKPDDEETEKTEPEGEEEAEEVVDETLEEKKPEVGTQVPVEGEGEKKEPKEVPGETPREIAWRKEAFRQKALLRKERGKKLLGDVQPQAAPSGELSEEEKKTLATYDPEQLTNLENAFTVLAKKHGYIKKDEFSKQTYTETSQEVLDEFLEQHEEYSAEKDPDGVLWKQFKEEFNLYQKPANPKNFKKIFNRIHNEIFGITAAPKQSLGQTAAKQEKLKVASAGGGAAKSSRLSDSRKAPGIATPELSKVARSGGLKGFTEEELVDMGL